MQMQMQKQVQMRACGATVISVHAGRGRARPTIKTAWWGRWMPPDFHPCMRVLCKVPSSLHAQYLMLTVLRSLELTEAPWCVLELRLHFKVAETSSPPCEPHFSHVATSKLMSSTSTPYLIICSHQTSPSSNIHR